jgi:hypothetical protein
MDISVCLGGGGQPFYELRSLPCSSTAALSALARGHLQVCSGLLCVPLLPLLPLLPLSSVPHKDVFGGGGRGVKGQPGVPGPRKKQPSLQSYGRAECISHRIELHAHFVPLVTCV